MNKPPAFQFYAADFLVDAAVKLMSLEERGAYVTLLAHAWIEGPLPGALPKLARLCEVSVGDMERIWPAIAPCWTTNAEGFLVNPRLEKERRKQAQYRKTQSEKALTRQASPKLAPAEPVPSSPSPSPSLRRKPVAPERARNDWVVPFVQAWVARFQGTAPWGRIGTALKPLREQYADDVILARWTRFLAQARSGYSTPEGFAQTFGDWAPQPVTQVGISRDVAIRRALNVLPTLDDKRIPRNGFPSDEAFQAWLDAERERVA